MKSIQNTHGISFAGAYLRYGFHEDGFTSGLQAAVEHLGASLPFPIVFAGNSPPVPWSATVFDILERSGLRVIIGSVMSFVLACLRTLLGVPVDTLYRE